jgi:hypothetical protein
VRGKYFLDTFFFFLFSFLGFGAKPRQNFFGPDRIFCCCIDVAIRVLRRQTAAKRRQPGRVRSTFFLLIRVDQR